MASEARISIAHVVKTVACEAGATNWTLGTKITMLRTRKVLKSVKVWFSRGTGNQVQVKITKGGGILLPDPSIIDADPPADYGDAISGDGWEFEFPMDTEVKKSETLEIYYRNTDSVDVHDIQVTFELHELPTELSHLRS